MLLLLAIALLAQLAGRLQIPYPVFLVLGGLAIAFVPGIPAKSPNNYKTPYRNWHDLGHNPTLNGVDHKQIVDQWCHQRVASAPRGTGAPHPGATR